MTETPKIAVLFVCMGNICRSPTAHTVFRQRVAAAGLADRIVIESAGTHDYHVGATTDRRACEAGGERGYTFTDRRARQVDPFDLERFDYVLAMDRSNLDDLQRLQDERTRAEIRLFLSDVPDAGDDEVPDPYYGATNGFEQVLDMVEAGSDALLVRLRQRHGL
jgi:protein-tyrosine phosphatase